MESISCGHSDTESGNSTEHVLVRHENQRHLPTWLPLPRTHTPTHTQANHAKAFSYLYCLHDPPFGLLVLDFQAFLHFLEAPISLEGPASPSALDLLGDKGSMPPWL